MELLQVCVGSVTSLQKRMRDRQFNFLLLWRLAFLGSIVSSRYSFCWWYALSGRRVLNFCWILSFVFTRTVTNWAGAVRVSGAVVPLSFVSYTPEIHLTQIFLILICKFLKFMYVLSLLSSANCILHLLKSKIWIALIHSHLIIWLIKYHDHDLLPAPQTDIDGSPNEDLLFLAQRYDSLFSLCYGLPGPIFNHF